ncbi:hypothetical protein B0H17DRAFT_1181634 [Mycena rosella]|uniref:Uncharacterized protein n=1 Tax=Mycena rosella TaxID=1033263 RepID=A0AAD7D7S1_MYCRO|nr:hypothetical protein B0H17DRAFT_1181634 [Mycena rosella]
MDIQLHSLQKPVEMFRQGFLPVVLASVGIGIKLYRMAWVDPPMGPLIEGYLKSCTYPTRNPFRSVLCVLEPFFRDFVSNDLGKSLLTGTGTCGMVMSTHFHLTAGQAGAPPLSSSFLTIASTLLGQVLGAGFAGPVLLPLQLALSKSLQPPRRGAAPPTPPPARYTLAVLGIHFCVFLLSGALTAVPPTTPAWTYVNYAFTLFPLLFVPLVFFPAPAPHVKEEEAPTLSVTVFKVYKIIYAPLWWISVAQGLNVYLRTHQFSLPTYWLALDLVGMVAAFLGMYAVDFVAGDTAGFGVEKVALGLVLAGPAATMAAYYEAKEREVVDRAAGGGKEKVKDL